MESSTKSSLNEKYLEEVKQWSNPLLGDEELTKHMRHTCAILTEQYLSHASEYAREKFIKDFCQPVHTLYSHLKEKDSLRVDDLDKNIRKRGPQVVRKRLKRLQSRIKNYINRKHRHVNAYFQAIQSKR